MCWLVEDLGDILYEAGDLYFLRFRAGTVANPAHINVLAIVLLVSEPSGVVVETEIRKRCKQINI